MLNSFIHYSIYYDLVQIPVHMMLIQLKSITHAWKSRNSCNWDGAGLPLQVSSDYNYDRVFTREKRIKFICNKTNISWFLWYHVSHGF